MKRERPPGPQPRHGDPPGPPDPPAAGDDGADLWKLVRDGNGTVATHAVLAAAVKHSPLLGDFLDLVVRDQFRTVHARRCRRRAWDDYLDGCRGRDADMPLWNESTRRRLRSSVFQTLAQAGYLDDTRTLDAPAGPRRPAGARTT